MSDQPHYPYADGNHAVLGPDVTATPDGMGSCAECTHESGVPFPCPTIRALDGPA